MSDSGISGEVAREAGRADLSGALGMDAAERVLGRLFALAPRLVEIQDLGARQYGMSYARGRVVAALHALGPVLMRKLSEAVGVTPAHHHRPGRRAGGRRLGGTASRSP